MVRDVIALRLASYQLAVSSAIICSRSERLRGLALDSALDFSPRELPRETVKQLNCRQGTTRRALNSSLTLIARRGWKGTEWLKCASLSLTHICVNGTQRGLTRLLYCQFYITNRMLCVQLGVVHKFNLFHVRFTSYGVHIEQVFLVVQLNWNRFAGLRNRMFSSPQIYKRIETLQGINHCIENVGIQYKHTM